MALVVLFFMLSGYHLRAWVSVLWHLALLLVVALACHGKLARSRPGPADLTEFYLLISLGGVLGGLFNAIVAPVVFTSLAEYPAAMVVASMLVAGGAARRRPALAVGLPLLAVAIALVTYSDALTIRVEFASLTRLLRIDGARLVQWVSGSEYTLNRILAYGLPLVVCLFARRRPAVLGVALAGVLAVSSLVESRKGEHVRQVRSFFGVLRISGEASDGYTELRHGTTLHGRQNRDPARRGEPLTYYHRKGPIGAIFAELDRRDTSRRVAVIGLGTGTLAAYARPGEAVTIYEIDRRVRDIAFDPAHFTYVSDARDRGASLRVELGDARLRLDAVRRERPGERYDLLVVDAFTSDAIPVHLMTREALRLYLDMLTPQGLVAVHISNRYLRLEPVVAALADDARVVTLLMDDSATEAEGGLSSTWVTLARTPEALGDLADDERWRARLERDPKVGVWTDDFHNLLSVFKW
jgi:hypothetical protein